MKTLAWWGFVVGLTCCAASSAQAVSLEFLPATRTIGLGGLATVGLQVTELGDFSAPSMGTFDVDVRFNSTILGFRSASYGDPMLGDQLNLSGSGSLTTTTTGSGSVNLFQLSLDPATTLNNLQAGQFTLATVTFQGAGIGVSALSFSVNALGDALGNPLTASLKTGSIQVVPEPATLLMLAMGLASLGLLRQKLFS